MGETLKPFVRHGTKEEPIELSADEILCAMTKGRKLDIEYAIINGDLNIVHDIQAASKKPEYCGPIIREIKIRHSKISGKTYFSGIDHHPQEWRLFLDYVASGESYEKVFLVLGHPENRIKLSASEILCAIAEGKNITITHAVIDGDLYTRKAKVQGDIIISNSAIKGNVDFSGTVFDKGTKFALIGGTTVSGHTRFRETVFPSQTTPGRTTFSMICTGDVDFYGAKPDGTVRFNGSEFNGYKIPPTMSKIDFSGKGFDDIGSECRRSILPCSKFFEYAGKWYWNDKQYPQAVKSFRKAKIEYEREGKSDEARVMYVKEKKSIQRSSIWKRVPYWIWYVTCNYGEKIGLFCLWMVGIILGFAFLYKRFPLAGKIENSMDAVYFSVVTFATLGLGDILPCGFLGKLFVVFEVLLGYVMFGILITLVARKMR